MKPVEERFWKKVDKRGDTECWLWKAGKHSKGYGHFWDHFKMEFAHRFAYKLLVGPIWTGLEIDHLCRNRACVNPAHMELVTMRENIRRGIAGHHPNSKANLLLSPIRIKYRGRLPDFNRMRSWTQLNIAGE